MYASYQMGQCRASMATKYDQSYGKLPFINMNAEIVYIHSKLNISIYSLVADDLIAKKSSFVIRHVYTT